MVLWITSYSQLSKHFIHLLEGFICFGDFFVAPIVELYYWPLCGTFLPGYTSENDDAFPHWHLSLLFPDVKNPFLVSWEDWIGRPSNLVQLSGDGNDEKVMAKSKFYGYLAFLATLATFAHKLLPRELSLSEETNKSIFSFISFLLFHMYVRFRSNWLAFIQHERVLGERKKWAHFPLWPITCVQKTRRVLRIIWSFSLLEPFNMKKQHDKNLWVFS